MNRILSLQFYLVSSSSAAPWPGTLPLQLRDPNYGNGDTNTFSKRITEQFTEYLTGWQICQLPVFPGLKTLQLRGGGLRPLTKGSALDPAGGSAPRALLQPHTATPRLRHWSGSGLIRKSGFEYRIIFGRNFGIGRGLHSPSAHFYCFTQGQHAIPDVQSQYSIRTRHAQQLSPHCSVRI